MQSVSSRIWTRVTVSNSYDDNHYTTGTSLLSFLWPEKFCSTIVTVSTAFLSSRKQNFSHILWQNRSRYLEEKKLAKLQAWKNKQWKYILNQFSIMPHNWLIYLSSQWYNQWLSYSHESLLDSGNFLVSLVSHLKHSLCCCWFCRITDSGL